VSRGTRRPGRVRLPGPLPKPHRFTRNAETGCCSHPRCHLPASNALRHLHQYVPDPRDASVCARCDQPAGDARHQDPAELHDTARAAAGEYVAA
jgi:hypothetical protein